MGEAFRAMGWELQEEDLIQIHPLSLPAELDLPIGAAWIFTSQHAVKNALAVIQSMDPKQRVYCLDGATRATLQSVSPAVEICGVANDGASLAKIIIQQEHGKAVLFCGNQRRPELPRMIADAGIDLMEVVVYETKLKPVIVPSDVDALLFFSPSAVQSFFQCNRISASTTSFAIGVTTANAIHEYNAEQKVQIASEPTQEAIFALLKQNFQTNSFESA
jgi:uroporphyrinogen-III synthase